MSCAACVARVEKAVNKLEGVKQASVNLLTNSMVVSYEDNLSSKDIIKAVKDSGYGAKPASKEEKTLAKEEDVIKPLFIRLIISFIFLIPLFYISMGYMMDWPIGYLKDNPLLTCLIEMFLSLTIMIINYPFFTRGFKALLHLSPNMDTLVALGSSVAFIYSTVLLILMSINLFPTADYEMVMHLSMNVSYETAGMVPTLIGIGKLLEAISKGKTTTAIKSLLDMSAKKATILIDDKEVEVDIEEIKVGDYFVVKPGESFPVDGVIKEGNSSADESILTGESMPVDKSIGDKVISASINQYGRVVCQATRVGNETTLNKIIKMVEDASSSKAPISKIADKVAGIFVPIVIAIAIIVFTFWMIFGGDYVANMDNHTTLLSYAFERAIAVLVISCPCALGLATPVAIMVGNGLAAKHGILFKNATALEITGKMDYLLLDKTGTISKGIPTVVDVYSENIDILLTYSYSLELGSEHPLSKAIINYGIDKGVTQLPIKQFMIIPGEGVKGIIDGQPILGGNYKLVSQYDKDGKYLKIGERYASEGKTPLYFLYNNKIIGIFAIRDEIKEDSIMAIKQMKDLGLHPIMLTGDNYLTAKAIANEVGIDRFISDVHPEEKLNVVKSLQKYGQVIMVGDGVNDAPSLTQADIGMAIGAGSDVAIEAADVVLSKSSLIDVCNAIRISRGTLRNIKENLFWAFIYNIIMIPIAAGILSPIGLAKLKPWYGAAAMALSSLTVVLNALRLNLLKFNNPNKFHRSNKKDLPEELFVKEDVSMNNKTINIKGMMCEHCVKHVSDALTKLGLEVKEISLKDNRATIFNKENISDEQIIEAIKEEGYEVTSID